MQHTFLVKILISVLCLSKHLLAEPLASKLLHFGQMIIFEAEVWSSVFGVEQLPPDEHLKYLDVA